MQTRLHISFVMAAVYEAETALHEFDATGAFLSTTDIQRDGASGIDCASQ